MKDEICQCLGENIKKYRKLRGFTQEKLADAMKMEIKSLSLIETGNCFVSSKTLAKLANILKTSPSDLLENCSSDPKRLYSDTLKALEIIKNSPAKLKTLNLIINGLL